LHSPFEKGGLRGIFEAPFSGRLALFKQLTCYKQLCFWHLDILISDLFRVSILGFRIYSFAALCDTLDFSNIQLNAGIK
ncbi:MAG: hypothetical protein AB1487_07105, partial [Thermodesulfobacteriota bacterium]